MGFLAVVPVGVTTDDPRHLGWLAGQLVLHSAATNRLAIRAARAAGRPLPRAYESGVVWFDSAPLPFQDFADCLTVLRRGVGDCKQLVAWRIAELYEDGHAAMPRVFCRDRSSPHEGWRMHALLRHAPQCACQLCHAQPDEVRRVGYIEDPSRLLGM